MRIDNSYILSLKNIANDALEKIEKEQIDRYINGVKSILFFIGRSVLSIKYLKENKKINFENLNVEEVDKNYSMLLTKILGEEEKIYEDNELLNEDLKNDIFLVLKEISKDELANFSLGKLFETFITNKQRKLLGQVYTPDYIVKYMISLGISSEEIIKNPYFSVVDPACGGGYFLLEAYDRIKEIFEENYFLIVQHNPEIEKEMRKGIPLFILKNNIFGFDIDPFAVFMTKISLILKGDIGDYLETNIYNRDVLIEENSDLIEYGEEKDIEDRAIGRYDLVIGNPPYIGHKSIDKDYRKRLQYIYYDVYSDKADISYCFFKKGYELLKDNGKLIFITSRYFLEAPSAKGLREFIVNKYKIDKIVDFYGKNTFKGIGISPLIIESIKNLDKKDNILVYRYSNSDSTRNFTLDLSNDFEKYYVLQEDLEDSGWLLLKARERNLFYKIDAQGDYILDEICRCNQGIITGCDKAFIVDSDTIEEKSLEKSICKPWVKNSEVRKYRNAEGKRFVLYTDLIENPNEYSNTISHITPFRDKLENRRECLTGTREWYKLQWGRNINIFTQPKILFPFKAMSNEFTIEYREVCCSADVYILSLRDEYKKKISLEYLAAFLNSSLFEFYFKSVAKKLSEGLYEYYPNKLMTLKIKIGTDRKSIENKVKKITDLYTGIKKRSSVDRNKKSEKDVKYILKEIDIIISDINNYFYSLYRLDINEIETIERTIETK